MRYFLLVILVTLFPNFSLSDEVTAEAQRLLNELGYNAGPVDGLIGGKTRNAMSDAFKSVGKEWDQELDEADLAILKFIQEQKNNGEPRTLAAAKTISTNDLGLPINYGENHELYVDFAAFEDDLINVTMFKQFSRVNPECSKSIVNHLKSDLVKISRYVKL